MPDPQYPFLANPDVARFDLLAWEVLRMLTGGNPTADSPYTLNDCRLAVEQVATAQQASIDTANKDKLRAATIENQAFQVKQYFEDMDALYKYGATGEAFLQTFRQWPVQVDEVTEERYLLLPEVFVKVKRYQNLPGEEWVRNVEPVKLSERFSRHYVPLSSDNAVLLERAGFSLEGNYGYARKGDKLYLKWERGTEPPVDTQLNFDAIIRPDRDDLVSPGLIADVTDTQIIAISVPMLQRKVQEDKVNDNTNQP